MYYIIAEGHLTPPKLALIDSSQLALLENSSIYFQVLYCHEYLHMCRDYLDQQENLP